MPPRPGSSLAILMVGATGDGLAVATLLTLLALVMAGQLVIEVVVTAAGLRDEAPDGS